MVQALPFSDNFNRANGAIGAPWSRTDFDLVSTVAHARIAHAHSVIDYGTDDIEQIVVLSKLGSTDEAGLAFRCTAGGTQYVAFGRSGVWTFNGTVQTRIHGYSQNFKRGDTMRVVLSGNTYTVYRNTTQVAKFDNAFNLGQTRHGLYGGTKDTRLNNYSAHGVPAVPTALAVTPGNKGLGYTFTAPSNGGSAITGYVIEAQNQTTLDTTSFPNQPVDTSNVVKGLAQNTPYKLRVAAKNGIGQGAFTAWSATVTTWGVPDQPENVDAAAGDTTADVFWDPPQDDGGSAVTGYHIEDTNGAHVQNVGLVATVHYAGLVNGTALAFRVSAVNAVGTGLAATTSAVTPATTPGAPKVVSLAPGGGYVRVDFSPPVSDGGSAIIEYVVIAYDNTATEVTRTTVDGDERYAIVSGLTVGQLYNFTVQAINGIGSGPESALSNAVAPTTAPGDLITDDYQYEYNGLLVGHATDWVVESVEGIFDLPDVKDNDLDRAYDHGAVPGQDFLDKRKIVVTMSMDVAPADSEAEALRLADAFKSGMAETPFIWRRPGQPLKACWGRTRRRSLPTSYELAHGQAQAVVQVDASDPRIYTLEELFAPLVTMAIGQTTVSVDIVSLGNFRSKRVRLVVTGGATNPRLKVTNQTPLPDGTAYNNNTIALDFLLASGETLEIDQGLKTVQVDGVDHYGYTRNDNMWWELLPGLNRITYTRSGTNVASASTLLVGWHDAWQ